VDQTVQGNLVNQVLEATEVVHLLLQLLDRQSQELEAVAAEDLQENQQVLAAEAALHLVARLLQVQVVHLLIQDQGREVHQVMAPLQMKVHQEIVQQDL
jgi:hypothetical protein